MEVAHGDYETGAKLKNCTVLLSESGVEVEHNFQESFPCSQEHVWNNLGPRQLWSLASIRNARRISQVMDRAKEGAVPNQ